MVGSINSTTVWDLNWEERCLQWAHERKPFMLTEVRESHANFCRQLCAEFRYEVSVNTKDGYPVMTFVPVEGFTC